MRIKLLTIFAVIMALIGSCESPYGKKMVTGVSSTGRVGEILIVCDEAIWNSEIKDVLDSNLTQWILPYFPDVATFELIHRAPSNFTKGIRKHRNVLILKLDGAYAGEKGNITKESGTYATDQLLIEIVAKNYDQMLESCKQGLNRVHKEFDDASWSRIMDRYRKQTNRFLVDEIKENFGISLALPQGSKAVWKKQNFYRVELPNSARPMEFVGTGSVDPGLIFRGIIIYQYNYEDSTQLTFESLAAARDTMLRYNVPGQTPGMYMGTQYGRITYPIMDSFSTASGVNGSQMRGMFVFTGRDKFGTGGAFWQCHLVNKKTNKIVCISGYVDAAPTTSWTQPLREVQAILKSVELVK